MAQKTTPMTMAACESKAFTSHGYDPATQTLALQFKSSGKFYLYPEVSVDLANTRLEPGTSLGRWYADNIKGKFTAVPWVAPIEPDTEEDPG